ncbi:hypothetical protein BB558_001228 [Smittium angustum]|uniref:Uncharacterized protein n=1 Tax=Smittium angustum TaxID=133377 RepID=A0A2U1JC68_SMIAN|nr:hypothetical protein BB558_001228 [Smittium angustum]
MSTCGFKDIPEAFESDLGEALQHRAEALASYRELGPPDLCVVTKIIDPGKRTEKEESTYHHVMGADASSSASLAAYINSLTYSLEEQSGWFGKSSSWKIINGEYCCYNAFSRNDVHVQIKIPGGVDAYIVTPQGDRKEPEEKDWLECGLSATLRALVYSEEEGYTLPALRRLRPIPNLKAEARFLNTAYKLFWKSWQLGSNSETQVATHTSNHLVDALENYFFSSGRYDEFIEFLKRLTDKDQELNSLVALAQFKGNKEVEGVRTLYQSIKLSPTSHRLLICQANFLISKGELDAALQIAEQTVRLAPSEFLPWHVLVQVLILQKKYIEALLTLNSCPMFTFSEKELPRVPPPKSLHQPIGSDITNGYDFGEGISVSNGGTTPLIATPTAGNKLTGLDRMSISIEVAANEKSGLLKLPAQGLRGTFSKAYEHLTKIVDEIGWDDLLKLRSAAFVMEEEYRNSIKSMNNETEFESKTSQNEEIKPVMENNSNEINQEKENNTEKHISKHIPTSENELEEKDTENVEKTNKEKSLDEFQDISIDETYDSESLPKKHSSEIVENQSDIDSNPTEKIENLSPEFDDKKVSQDDITDQLATDLETIDIDGDSTAITKTLAQETPPLSEDNIEEISDIHSETENNTKENLESDKIELLETDKEVELLQLDQNQTKNSEEIPQVDGANDSNSDNESNRSHSFDEENESQREFKIPVVDPKRLCERWLDNLFMVLYEDLRVYTMWRTEMYHLKTAGKPILSRHTQLEWEALGAVSYRLRHFEESKSAYLMALDYRFSFNSWIQVLKLNSKLNAVTSADSEDYPIAATSKATTDAEMKESLDAITWLIIYMDRWYNDSIYPTLVCKEVLSLISKHGLSKVQNTIISMNLKPSVYKLAMKYTLYSQEFHTKGYNW